MQVKPVASRSEIQPTSSNQTSLTARAVQAFNQAGAQQAQQHPVPNPSQISPEDVGAIRSNTSEDERSLETEGQATQEASEAPQEAITKPTEQQDSDSRRFAQMARREKELRIRAQKQDEALRAREAALTAKEQELSSKYKTDYNGYYSKDQIKQNYLQVLVDSGVPIEEAVQQLVNTSNQPRDIRTEATITELRQQIQELKTANEDSKKSQIEAQNQQYQAAVKQIRTDVSKLVYTDPTFETIKATNSIKDVVELITETYNKDGVLLSIEDAANQVEDYLVDEAMKLTKLQKIQKKYAESSAKSKPTSTPSQTQGTGPKQTQQMKTLTNAVASSRPLSARERALLAFKGELKS